ncbi:MAG: ribulose phosphate epimerase [Myxococcales bacterium]|nr:ribulose phosphate epimerase [Myxococcales bacterium]
MIVGRALGALGLVAGLGCGPQVLLEEEGDADVTGDASDGPSTTGVTTVPPPSTSTSTTSPPPPPGTTTSPPPPPDGTDDSVFIPDPDSGDWGDRCDVFAQDCPDGEKCMPWANDGGQSWNALRCSPIFPNPGQPGAPCLVEGSPYSGIDSCDLGGMCWEVDPETLTGTCVAMCTGGPDAPMCEPGFECVMANDGVLALCLASCNPLAQDCFEGEGCYPVTPSIFECAPDASGGAGAGQPCDYINACTPGTMCADIGLVPDCMGPAGCCTSFCSLGDPAPPCLPGQTCEPYFALGSAPPGYELLGVCEL